MLNTGEKLQLRSTALPTKSERKYIRLLSDDHCRLTLILSAAPKKEVAAERICASINARMIGLERATKREECMIEVVTRDDRIVVHATIEAPRESVWQALTEKEHIAKWWGAYVSLEAWQGGRLTEHWTDDRGREVLTSGEVVRLAAPRMLELTWADDDWDASTRVLFELAQVADATHLTLTHSGWEALPSSRREGLIRELASGWSRHMANLEAHLRGALG